MASSFIYAGYPNDDRAEKYAKNWIRAISEHGIKVRHRDSGNDDSRSLMMAKALLLILPSGPCTAGIRPVKECLNHALDRGIPVITLEIGEPEYDTSLEMQLGLAQKIRASEHPDPDSEPDANTVAELVSQIHSVTQRVFPWKPAVFGVIGAMLVVFGTWILPKILTQTDPDSYDADVTAAVSETDTIVDVPDMDDAILRALLRAGADEDGDGRVSKEELASLKVLDLSGNAISDLSPLVYATELTELDLSDNQITDITPLAALTSLKKLILTGNPVEDYTVLAFLPDLEIAETDPRIEEPALQNGDE